MVPSSGQPSFYPILILPCLLFRRPVQWIFMSRYFRSLRPQYFIPNNPKTPNHNQKNDKPLYTNELYNYLKITSIHMKHVVAKGWNGQIIPLVELYLLLDNLIYKCSWQESFLDDKMTHSFAHMASCLMLIVVVHVLFICSTVSSTSMANEEYYNNLPPSKPIHLTGKHSLDFERKPSLYKRQQ